MSRGGERSRGWKLLTKSHRDISLLTESYRDIHSDVYLPFRRSSRVLGSRVEKYAFNPLGRGKRLISSYMCKLESMHAIWRDTPFCHECRDKVHQSHAEVNANDETPFLDDCIHAKWYAYLRVKNNVRTIIQHMTNEYENTFRSSSDEGYHICLYYVEDEVCAWTRVDAWHLARHAILPWRPRQGSPATSGSQCHRGDSAPRWSHSCKMGRRKQRPACFSKQFWWEGVIFV